MRPDREFRAVMAMFRLFRRLRPAVVHLVTIKPVLYGGLAARLARVPAVVYAISGMGYLFSGDGRGGMFVSTLVRRWYRFALGHGNSRVIVQNADDRNALVGMGALLPERAVLIPGSGVDLERFRPVSAPGDPPVVVLPARMLADKGVEEFVAAAEMLRGRGTVARFVLAGDVDPGNPSSIDAQRLRAWQADGVVEWRGHCDDMPRLLQQAGIVCLPSYREGMPLSLLEAAAAGRPVVTTDVPGCREAIIPGTTGLLVPARDPAALADAIEGLLRDPEACERMGAAARHLAERRYSLDQVVAEHLHLYAELAGTVPNENVTPR